MKNTTCQLLSALLLSAFFAACSRPVAYVQKSPRETFATAASPVAPATTVTPSSDAIETLSPGGDDVFTGHTQPIPAALDQVDALVRNDTKLVVDKTLQKRLSRVRTLLAASATPSASLRIARNRPSWSG